MTFGRRASLSASAGLLLIVWIVYPQSAKEPTLRQQFAAAELLRPTAITKGLEDALRVDIDGREWGESSLVVHSGQRINVSARLRLKLDTKLLHTVHIYPRLVESPDFGFLDSRIDFMGSVGRPGGSEWRIQLPAGRYVARIYLQSHSNNAQVATPSQVDLIAERELQVFGPTVVGSIVIPGDSPKHRIPIVVSPFGARHQSDTK